MAPLRAHVTGPLAVTQVSQSQRSITCTACSCQRTVPASRPKTDRVYERYMQLSLAIIATYLVALETQLQDHNDDVMLTQVHHTMMKTKQSAHHSIMVPEVVLTNSFNN